MLFMHEVHKLRGLAEDRFEAAFREGWMPTLGAGDEARRPAAFDGARASANAWNRQQNPLSVNTFRTLMVQS